LFIGRKEKDMVPAILLFPDQKGRRLLYMIGRHINTSFLLAAAVVYNIISNSSSSSN
jgi:hypothetical protein